MPELPEVEAARRLLLSRVKDHVITEVTASNDSIVFDGQSPARVRRWLRGAQVEDVGRRGKYLWLAINRRPQPVFHLGMTGSFRFPGEQPLALESDGAVEDRAWPPRFCKLVVSLDDGTEFAFVNKRRLGRVIFRDDPITADPIAGLGPDAYDALPPTERFAETVGKKRGTLKGMLLDQRFLAGVGNWIADEVLYHAGLDPRRTGASLSDAETERLRQALVTVLNTAVSVDADKARFPAEWLFHRRWGKQTDATTWDGHPIEHLTVGGRTTAWVPVVQE